MMIQNLKIAAWLVIGTMTISSGISAPAAVAARLEPALSLSQANLNSVDAISQYQQGLKAASVGDMPNALDRFNRAIKFNPQYFQAYIERGNVKDAIRDFAGAIADYTTAISLNPKSAHAFYNRGTVLSRSESHQAAIADYQKAIAIDPEYAQAHLNLANELDDLEDTAGAMTNYDRAIALKPNYALAYLNRGIMYSRMGDRSKAIGDLRQAAKLFQSIGHIDRYNHAMKMIKDIQSEV
jgi:tetratricopeptide (TPR) repeat protein